MIPKYLLRAFFLFLNISVILGAGLVAPSLNGIKVGQPHATVDSPRGVPGAVGDALRKASRTNVSGFSSPRESKSISLEKHADERSLTDLQRTGSLERVEHTSQTTRLGEAVDKELETRRQLTWQEHFEEFKEAVRKNLAPARDYISLISRYHKWYRGYKALEKLALVKGTPIAQAKDVILQEYSKVDELQGQELEQEDRGDEGADFVFDALEKTIKSLEPKLEEMTSSIRPSGVRQELIAPLEVEDQANEERVKAAMDRVKRVAMNEARKFAFSEMMNAAKIASMHGIGIIVSHPNVVAATPAPLSMLLPLVASLGNSQIPLMTALLTNIEFRAALEMIKHLNPMRAILSFGKRGQ